MYGSLFPNKLFHKYGFLQKSEAYFVETRNSGMMIMSLKYV